MSEQEVVGAATVLPEDPPAGAAPAVAAARGRHQAPEPPSAARRRALVLVAALALLLVAVAIAMFVWPGLLVADEPSDGGAASEQPVVASVTLVTPPSVAGMTRLGGAADAALRSRLSTSPVPGLTGAVSAVYGVGGAPTAQVIAWKAIDPPPQDSVDAAFTGFEGSADTQVTAVRALPAGQLGGHMACGMATVSSTSSLLCFWADDGSFGSITMLSPKDRAAAETAAAAIRAAVEVRS